MPTYANCALACRRPVRGGHGAGRRADDDRAGAGGGLQGGDGELADFPVRAKLKNVLSEPVFVCFCLEEAYIFELIVFETLEKQFFVQLTCP